MTFGWLQSYKFLPHSIISMSNAEIENIAIVPDVVIQQVTESDLAEDVTMVPEISSAFGHDSESDPIEEPSEDTLMPDVVLNSDDPYVQVRERAHTIAEGESSELDPTSVLERPPERTRRTSRMRTLPVFSSPLPRPYPYMLPNFEFIVEN